MLSDLPIGDKMSLKGKIFELGKKLNLLEVQKAEQKRLGLVFKPTLIAQQQQAPSGDVEQRLQRAVGLVHRQCLAEVLKVAV